MPQDLMHDAVTLIADATLDKNILSLLQIGWYVPQRIRLRTVYDLAKLANAGQEDAASQIIVLFFRKHRKALEEYLNSCYPGQPLISEGFRAHEKKMYNASVLLMLAATRYACVKNLSLIQSILADSHHAQSRSINRMLEQDGNLSGFFDSGIRAQYFEGQRVSGEIESLKSIGLLAFITDFVSANRPGHHP